jgi:cytochrome c biogenesis protein CcmG/thiol:disulfide interchange protein DsbE
MTARRQWTLVISVALLLAGAAFAATHALRDEIFPVTLGSEAPQFEAATLDTPPTTRTFEDYRGKVVLLNVWATWCRPCIVEMPTIQRLHEEFAGTDLAVVAVSVDQPNTENAIRAFVKEHGLTFDVLHDPENDISSAYQVPGYPATFIIGRDGVIRKKVVGAADWSSEGNRALVRQLLSERRA